MEPLFFAESSEFACWLREHHETETELWVGFYKKASGKPSISWPESVDEALCVGWIDGVRKRLDDESYVIRFTPRKRTSSWSAVNLRNMERLLKEGRVLPRGVEIWKARSKKASGYSYEQRKNVRLDDGYLEALKENKKAHEYFEEQAPWYQRAAIHWVMSAKREETRQRRLKSLIEHSAMGEPIPPLRRS